MKNVFEFYLIPILVIILPLKVYYPIFRFVCSKTLFYKKYSWDSFSKACQIVKIQTTEKQWDRNVRLLYLVDISDYWLAKYRPNKMLRQISKEGNWEDSKGHLLLGLHYGPGYITLVDLRNSNLFPYFVYSEPQTDYKFQSFIESRYRKARIKHINKISGSTAISTGGGYDKIKTIVSNSGMPIVLFDAPRFDKESKYALDVFNKKYNVASGFVNLICYENINFQLYTVRLNFQSGKRELLISDFKNQSSSLKLILELSEFFEKMIISSPEQWYFWRQSNNLLRDNINE